MSGRDGWVTSSAPARIPILITITWVASHKLTDWNAREYGRNTYNSINLIAKNLQSSLTKGKNASYPSPIQYFAITSLLATINAFGFILSLTESARPIYILSKRKLFAWWKRQTTRGYRSKSDENSNSLGVNKQLTLFSFLSIYWQTSWRVRQKTWIIRREQRDWSRIHPEIFLFSLSSEPG